MLNLQGTSGGEERKFDLEERLVAYACMMMSVVAALPNDRIGNYYAGQLVRSANSPAFNYAEAQAAESRPDFIHKMKVCLKELKECRTTLEIINKLRLIVAFSLEPHRKETNELISIFGRSIETAKRNARKQT
ncbi:MAG: four helix bundle protein [Chitinophagaceae bacterium]|nr:MAG: four helix bundle protein [Chitinophagaceae bacterium]